MAKSSPQKGGRYGAPHGWLEHEVDHYLINSVRVSRGLPPLPEPAPPGLGDHVAILREPEVHRRTGISRVMRWKMERDGRFPRRIKLAGFGAENADAASQ